MDAKVFLQKLKQHCTEVGASCETCCFREFCYSFPTNYFDDLISSAIARFSSGLSTSGREFSKIQAAAQPLCNYIRQTCPTAIAIVQENRVDFLEPVFGTPLNADDQMR